MKGNYWSWAATFFYTLKLLGHMPFGIGEDGMFVPYTLRSWIWTTLSATIQLLVLSKAVVSDNAIAKYGQSYVGVVDFVMRVMASMKAPHLLATWISMSRIAVYVSRWQEFEVKFSTVTKTSLPILRPWTGKCTVVTFAVLVASLVVLDEHLFKAHGSAWTMLSYFFSAYYASLIVTFWSFHCIYLVKISRLLRSMMLKEVFNCKNPDADKIRSVRLLWIDLRGLLSGLVEAFSIPITTQVTFYFVMYIFSSYTLLNALVDEQALKIVGFVTPWVWSCLVINVIIESYHKVHNEVVKHILLLIFSTRVPNLPMDSKTQTDLFIDSLLDKSPPEELSRFIKLDRTLAISMTSRLITFLIVLMQFDSRTVSVKKHIQQRPSSIVTLEAFSLDRF